MRKELRIPTVLVFGLLTALVIYFLSKGNFEFLVYAGVVALFYWIILKLDKKYGFPSYSIWLFVGWVYLHMLGGTLYFGGVRLYDLVLIPLINGGGELVILKYDQLVHAFCYLMVAVLVYYILKNYFRKKDEKILILFVILSAIGIGLLNEVIEFGMVLFADAAEAVGGYYNTALDLVFNLIGAVIGAGIARRVD